ncbi:hypothetical protein Fot_20203 [Forsythia ovata]|uniref:Uncharacterized protein n=1 Tax=Forsythia ovata TaxID=205694 RepID=A0ABD1VN77_9LAMI
MVVEERGPLSLRLPVQSTAPNPASTVAPVMGVVDGFSSLLPTSSTAPVLSAIDLPVMEVGDDSSSLPLGTSMSPSIDVQHQDKEKGVVVNEREKMASERALKDEGSVVDSGRVKWSRTVPLQGTSESVPTSPITVHDLLIDSCD